jgi:two-component system nitrate/nitrite response regulator NarL
VRRTRILVADPMPLFRSGVRNLLLRASDFAVLEAGTVDEAVEVARSTRPDIALIDLDLPSLGGVEAVVRIAAAAPVQSIVWSVDPPREAVLGAIRAGASGYLDKQVSSSGLLRAIRGLDEGEAPISRGLALQMIEALHGLDRRDRALELASRLSRREREVLERVAHGARNREIADSLAISEFTVKRHVQNILQKLELGSRNAAASFYEATFAHEALPA